MMASKSPPLAFAPTASRVEALEQALELIIAARKLPPLLADAIDIAERVLNEGMSFPVPNGIVAGPVALAHRVPMIGADPVITKEGN